METVQRRDCKVPHILGLSSQNEQTESYIQVDAIVSSVNRMGVFADVGLLPVFVSNHVQTPTAPLHFGLLS